MASCVGGTGRRPAPIRHEELGAADGAVDIAGAEDIAGATDGAVLTPGRPSEGEAVVGEHAAKTADATRRHRNSNRFMERLPDDRPIGREGEDQQAQVR